MQGGSRLREFGHPLAVIFIPTEAFQGAAKAHDIVFADDHEGAGGPMCPVTQCRAVATLHDPFKFRFVNLQMIAQDAPVAGKFRRRNGRLRVRIPVGGCLIGR